MINLLKRIDRDVFASSIKFGLSEKEYDVVHCSEEKSGFIRLMYKKGTGDGSFEREAKGLGWELIKNDLCCRKYHQIAGANACGYCGAGVNGKVVYRKDLLPRV